MAPMKYSSIWCRNTFLGLMSVAFSFFSKTLNLLSISAEPLFLVSENQPVFLHSGFLLFSVKLLCEAKTWFRNKNKAYGYHRINFYDHAEDRKAYHCVIHCGTAWQTFSRKVLFGWRITSLWQCCLVASLSITQHHDMMKIHVSLERNGS